ncbi:MAG TPA: hypothetical protein VGK10_06760 [Prolixibacteraceae bacterium]
MMESLKLGDGRIIIAIGEIVSTALFLFPKTNKWGIPLFNAYMGGAIVAHRISGLPIYMPSVILILVWVVGFLRNRELIRFNG